MHDNSSTLKSSKERVKIKVPMNIKLILMFDQCHRSCNPYIFNVIDVKTNGHRDYRSIAA